MSAITATISRKNDHRILCVKAVIDKDSDYVTIQVLQDDKVLEIYSTSHGSISDEHIKIGQPTKCGDISLTVECPDRESECLISYFKQDELISSESLPILIPKTKAIAREDVNAVTIATASSTFDNRLEEFHKELNRLSSKWKVSLTCPDDIVLNITTCGDKRVIVTFGEESREVLSSDYIFTLFPGITPINLPKEVFWNKYDQYKANANLGLYELVSPDFIASNNMYFKIPISNLMRISSFTRKSVHGIVEFQMPTGCAFDTGWIIGNLGLPIRDT